MPPAAPITTVPITPAPITTVRAFTHTAALIIAGLLFTGYLVAFGPVTAARAGTPPPAPPVAGALFGASVTATTGQTSPQAVAAEEARLGRGLGTNRSYARWDYAQPTGTVRDDIAHGRTPMLSIVPQRSDGTKITWAVVAAGTQDATIRAQADGLRDLGRPVILIFHHEADIAVGYGPATDFVAAYRHYVSVFRSEGATNVAFAVAFVPLTFVNPSAWYPGDDVVDWIGTDVYNSASCTTGATPWRTLAQAASTFYGWGSTRGKPLLLAEWGSAEDPAQPGRRAAWFRDAAVTLAGWPAVKAVAYFDNLGTCDWRLSISAQAQSAFAEISRQAWANGAPSARLLASAAVGPAPLAETFDLSTSTGSGSATGTGVTGWTLDFGDATPPAQGTGPPAAVTHTYLAGHRTATLAVLDAAGGQATTTTSINAAPPPLVTEGTATGVTATTATVPAWVNTSALAGTYYIQWGPSIAYGQQTAGLTLAALDYTQSLTALITGLAPGARTHWRLVATSAAGTTAGPDRYFSTPPT